jgi:hypothetical protein
MRPYDVSSEEQNLVMESDNHPQDYRVWSILNHSDKVSLHPPANSDWVGFVEIPRAEFNEIVDWYIKDQSADCEEQKSLVEAEKPQVEAGSPADPSPQTRERGTE